MTESPSEFNDRRSVLTPGSVLQDRYRIVRQLGKGGMGAVYEAVDQRLEVTVALKEAFSVNDRLRRQFEQEARLLAQLHHPALPRVSDYFTEGDRAFLVMQFIPGADLAKIIANQPGPFPRKQVIAWADQLLDALTYLHTRDRQIVHRDIKPHNLKLTSSGQIALLDFGLAKAQAVDASTTNSSASIFGYTKRYSPLEQIQDQGTSPRSDIYALGATLYHLLTGVKPPDALARASALVNSQRDELRPADEVNRAVGAELAAILSRAMALNPEDRYASAQDFREALRKLGRKEIAREDSAEFSVAPASDSTMNGARMMKPRSPATDPFDSYAILKPDQMAWLAPKPNHLPTVIAGILIVLAAVGLGTFYEFGDATDLKESVSDYASTTVKKNSGGSTVIRETTSDNSSRLKATNAASVKSTSSGFALNVNGRNSSQKRRSGRAIGGRSRAPRVEPQPSTVLP